MHLNICFLEIPHPFPLHISTYFSLFMFGFGLFGWLFVWLGFFSSSCRVSESLAESISQAGRLAALSLTKFCITKPLSAYHWHSFFQNKCLVSLCNGVVLSPSLLLTREFKSPITEIKSAALIRNKLCFGLVFCFRENTDFKLWGSQHLCKLLNWMVNSGQNTFISREHSRSIFCTEMTVKPLEHVLPLSNEY